MSLFIAVGLLVALLSLVAELSARQGWIIVEVEMTPEEAEAAIEAAEPLPLLTDDPS